MKTLRWRHSLEIGCVIEKSRSKVHDPEPRPGSRKYQAYLRSAYPKLAGCGKTRWAGRNFIGLYVWDNRSTPPRMLKKARRLTRPAPARRDAPFRGQGRSSAAEPRFTFHASRFTAAGSDARTPLAAFFSILLRALVFRSFSHNQR